MKRSTERELLLEALRADTELPPGLAERLDAIVSTVEPSERAETIQKVFEELAE